MRILAGWRSWSTVLTDAVGSIKPLDTSSEPPHLGPSPAARLFLKITSATVAGLLGLGFGTQANAGQFGSELGAHAGAAPVVNKGKHVRLDLSPEAITASVQHTLQEEDRQAHLFTLPKPDPRFDARLSEKVENSATRGDSRVAKAAMKRIAEIMNEEPRIREKLMANRGSVGFTELTVGQQNRIADVILSASGAYGVFDPVLELFGIDPATDKAEDLLASGFNFVVDPIAPGVGIGYSHGRPEKWGRVSFSFTYDQATSNYNGGERRNGIEAMLNYQLAF